MNHNEKSPFYVIPCSSTGEIAAIIIPVLVVFAIIVAIVIAIIYWKGSEVGTAGHGQYTVKLQF